MGRSGRAEARWLLPKICDAGSIAKDGIGAIRVREDETFVQIAEALASRFGGTVELDKGLTMERIEGEPDLDKPRFVKPERAERPERTERPERARKARLHPEAAACGRGGGSRGCCRANTRRSRSRSMSRALRPAMPGPEWKDKRQDDRPARPAYAERPAYADRAPRAEGD